MARKVTTIPATISKYTASPIGSTAKRKVAAYARVALDQEEYQRRYDGLVGRYDKAKARLDEVSAAISDNKARSETIRHFIRTPEKQDGVIAEFDDALWGSLVDYITVYSKDDIWFTFKDGTEIRA